MIYGLGIDVTDINRILNIYIKNSNFAVKILTLNEIKVFNNLQGRRKLEFLAGRFSIKESYSKAIGRGIGSEVSFQNLEILNNSWGQPYFNKYPHSDKLNAYCSISHTKFLVNTEVILEKRG